MQKVVTWPLQTQSSAEKHIEKASSYGFRNYAPNLLEGVSWNGVTYWDTIAHSATYFHLHNVTTFKLITKIIDFVVTIELDYFSSNESRRINSIDCRFDVVVVGHVIGDWPIYCYCDLLRIRPGTGLTGYERVGDSPSSTYCAFSWITNFNLYITRVRTKPFSFNNDVLATVDRATAGLYRTYWQWLG